MFALLLSVGSDTNELIVDVVAIDHAEEEHQALVVKSTTYQEPEPMQTPEVSSVGSLDILDFQ